jgi:ferredoxin
MKVHIDAARCQGHGRCYDLAPAVFGEDEEGYGQVLHGGLVPPGQESQAALAETNCPERAIEAEEAAP